MKKKLKIQFIRNENCLAFCVKEQEGLLERKSGGCVEVSSFPMLLDDKIRLRGAFLHLNDKMDVMNLESVDVAEKRINFFIDAIAKELFPGVLVTVDDLKDGDKCLVKSSTGDKWKERIFVSKIRNRFICEIIEDSQTYFVWKYCKPLNAKDVFFVKDVQEVHGTEITTCTWEVE